MHISLSTGTFYHRSVSYSLELARAAGFDGVELALGLEYLLGASKHLTQIERAVASTGVPVLSVHPPLRLLPGWPRKPIERIARLVEVAERLGADVCVVHAGMYASEASPRAQQFAAAL